MTPNIGEAKGNANRKLSGNWDYMFTPGQGRLREWNKRSNYKLPSKYMGTNACFLIPCTLCAMQELHKSDRVRVI